MAELRVKGIIDFIEHRWDDNTSIIDVGVGNQWVKIERPMTRKFEWKRDKHDEQIQSGDIIEIILKTIPRGPRR